MIGAYSYSPADQPYTHLSETGKFKELKEKINRHRYMDKQLTGTQTGSFAKTQTHIWQTQKFTNTKFQQGIS